MTRPVIDKTRRWKGINASYEAKHMWIIKFRAWDREMKKMRTVKRIELDNKRIFVQDNNEIGVFLYEGEYDLIESTGLLDKNGNEIYEGDVISCKNSRGFEHKDTIKIGWALHGEYGFLWSTSKMIVSEPDCISERYQIIGNIYENPELISVI